MGRSGPLEGVTVESLKPPTDSLYKFVSIAGILLTVLAVWLPELEVRDLNKQLLDLELTIAESRAKLEFIALDHFSASQWDRMLGAKENIYSAVLSADENNIEIMDFAHQEPRRSFLKAFRQLEVLLLQRCNHIEYQQAAAYFLLPTTLEKYTQERGWSNEQYQAETEVALASIRDGEHSEIIAEIVAQADETRRVLPEVYKLMAGVRQVWRLEDRKALYRTSGLMFAMLGCVMTAIGFRLWLIHGQLAQDQILRGEAMKAEDSMRQRGRDAAERFLSGPAREQRGIRNA